MPIFHDTGVNMVVGGEEQPISLEEAGRTRSERSRRVTPEIWIPSTDGGRLNREQLIDSLKKRDISSWTMRQSLERKSPDRPPTRTSTRQSPPTSLLPAAELEETLQDTMEHFQDPNVAGEGVERPRSALHTGDFREDKESSSRRSITSSQLTTSSVAPWHPQFSSFADSSNCKSRSQSRLRTVSHSSIPNFIFMPPTSPLVQAECNSDLDFSPTARPQRREARSPSRESRRHTLSPSSLQSLRSSRFSQSSPSTRPLATLRREGMFPCQAHQPRRESASLFRHQPNSPPRTPLLRPKGGSNIPDFSPIHHAPMVGSYEESILRGRMSTAPSRPLNFVAQIGVLGKGTCKASLRCPPHVTVPFPAVFYDFGGGNGRISDSQPSPYVGFIDLENSLSASEAHQGDDRRRRRHAASKVDQDPGVDDLDTSSSKAADQHQCALRLRKERLDRRTRSIGRPRGGSYRIPQEGQLQVVIKNADKTGVKVFLIPYNLSDMEPSRKTFIHQRIYSTGPLIDMPVSAGTHIGPDRPEASSLISAYPASQPILRYLIQLHICCLSEGRYFLYNYMRVVFANRVPEGTEKLRIETKYSDPKYSIYKPARDSQRPSFTGLATGLKLDALQSSQGSNEVLERQVRRRSTPVSFARAYADDNNGLDWSKSPYGHVGKIKPIPFAVNGLEPLESRPVSREQMDVDGPSTFPGSILDGVSENPFSLQGLSEGRNDPSSAWMERRMNPYLISSEGTPTSEGLLARQLRGLSVEREDKAGTAEDTSC